MPGLDDFLEENSMRIVGKIAKGWSSEIYLAETGNGEKIILKALRQKSNRKEMVKRESENLRMANSIGVGPKLILADLKRNIVVMECIEGLPFSKWLDSRPGKEELEKFIAELFRQASELDRIGLDHGQLAGAGKNILVRKGLPVIIDFEKASAKRKSHNVNVLESFLFKSPGSAIAKKVNETLEI